MEAIRIFHSFDVDLAVEYGLAEAIILNHLWFWIAKNKANGKHQHDGATWTYNSTKAFQALFPYLSNWQIQSALKRLREAGIIQTGNYNELSYDRTLWYAFTDFGKSIMQKTKMDYTKNENGLHENHEPIPDIIPDNIPDIKTDIYIGDKPKKSNGGKKTAFVPPTLDEVKAYCAERGNNINAEQFIDYYEARGWELTKGRKMVDWKAAVRTWERNQYNKQEVGRNGVKLTDDYDHDLDDILK